MQKNNKSVDCEGITASIDTIISVQTDTINVTLPHFLAIGTAWMAPFPTAFIKKGPLEFVLPGSGNLSVFNHHVGIGIIDSYNSITIHGSG